MPQRQDIITGLVNAIDRGYSLEQAKITLINSGYNQQDVERASLQLTGGTGLTPQKIQLQTQQPQTQQAKQPQTQQQSQIQLMTPKKKFPWEIFILVIITLMLLTALALMFIFRESITGFFQNLFT